MSIRTSSPHPTRRAVARTTKGVALLGAAALFVAACGSDDDSSAATVAETEVAPVESEAESTGDATAFPVTFDTKFGETVIESLPQRVVSVGYTEGDLILALGVTPVAIRDWYGEQPNGLWPWAAESPAAQSGEIVAMDSAEVNFEQIASLDPDVIFAIGSGIVQDDFDKLSAIAPTVAQTDDYNDFGTPWDVAQLMIGKALGLETQAQGLVDDVNAQIAAAVEANPEWQEMTGTVSVINADGTIGVFTDGDNRGHLLTQLGFAIPEEITEIAGESFYADISPEQIGLLDNDLLVYTSYPASDRELVEALPLFQGLTAVQEGRTAFLDDLVGGAMAFSSTLSIPYALDALVPQIQAALGEG
jgi:iron complex transport system substrate-binding protein